MRPGLVTRTSKTPVAGSGKPLVAGLLAWLRGATVGPLTTFRVDADPSPAHRPRFRRDGGCYYAESYAAYKSACVHQIVDQLTKELRERGLIDCRLAVVLDTCVKRPARTSLATPKGDADNYAKAPMDAATQAGVWKDDGQVAVVASAKRWTEAGESPGVSVHLGVLPA